MTFCVTGIFWPLIKIILEFAFEVDLLIRLQTHALARSDKHISANKCYNNFFSCMSYLTQQLYVYQNM
jgi:hypothetical protein